MSVRKLKFELRGGGEVQDFRLVVTVHLIIDLGGDGIFLRGAYYPAETGYAGIESHKNGTRIRVSNQ